MSDSLYGRLRELAESDLYAFHMPGHKRNLDWYSMDISEISGFDNLHFSENILLDAQRKAADLYQADETFYLINGSTAGILSAVSAINNGKKLLMSRNSHFSVYHAAYLNGVAIEYLNPLSDAVTGISQGISTKEVVEKLKNDPEIGAVLITSPTYEGIISDIAGIANVVHEYGACLIVDQAHGAHFGFHQAFPENAVKQGADIVIHSLHKTLPALTQTALLHVTGTRIDRRKLKRFLRIYQSSSPSYPLMAGIERCLDFVKAKGEASLDEMLKLREELIDRTSQLHHFKIKQVDDPCKIVVVARGLSGSKLGQILRERYLLEMEMAADNYIIAIITMMEKPEGLKRFADALCELDNQLPPFVEQIHYFTKPYLPEAVVTIKKAYDGEAIKIPLSEAEGYIAAEFAFLYPPGRPLIVPGEKIDRHMIDLLLKQGDTFWILR